MKKKIALALILCCIIVLMICFSGCVEERQPTTTEKSQYIEGLRHIQATASRYSDDDYPTDYEGIDVAAIFIGERGYPLEFKGVPVNITVEVYGYSSSYDWYQSNLRNTTLLYTKTVTVYGTGEDGSPPYVRIPFEDIPDLEKYHEEGAVKVTVEPSKQEVYTDWDESVPLYTRKYK